MDAAAEEASREKHEKRLRKLQQGGHDTKQLNAKFEGRVTTANHFHYKSYYPEIEFRIAGCLLQIFRDSFLFFLVNNVLKLKMMLIAG